MAQDLSPPFASRPRRFGPQERDIMSRASIAWRGDGAISKECKLSATAVDKRRTSVKLWPRYYNQMAFKLPPLWTAAMATKQPFA